MAGRGGQKEPVIGRSLRRLMDVGNSDQRGGIKNKVCKQLRKAYENTLWTDYVVDLDIPGGPGKSPSQKGVEDPRRPGDEIEEEYKRANVVLVSQENPRKREILDEALRWGCEWAQKEHIRLGGKFALKPRTKTKKR